MTTTFSIVIISTAVKICGHKPAAIPSRYKSQFHVKETSITYRCKESIVILNFLSHRKKEKFSFGPSPISRINKYRLMFAYINKYFPLHTKNDDRYLNRKINETSVTKEP